MIRATQKGGSLHNTSSTGLPLTGKQEKQKLYSKQGHQSEPPSCLLTVWGVRWGGVSEQGLSNLLTKNRNDPQWPQYSLYGAIPAQPKRALGKGDLRNCIKVDNDRTSNKGRACRIFQQLIFALAETSTPNPEAQEKNTQRNALNTKTTREDFHFALTSQQGCTETSIPQQLHHGRHQSSPVGENALSQVIKLLDPRRGEADIGLEEWL